MKMGPKKQIPSLTTGNIPAGLPPAGTPVVIVFEIPFDDQGVAIPGAACWIVKTATIPATELKRFNTFQDALNFALKNNWVP
jgi:hypothetical protein